MKWYIRNRNHGTERKGDFGGKNPEKKYKIGGVKVAKLCQESKQSEEKVMNIRNFRWNTQYNGEG